MCVGGGGYQINYLAFMAALIAAGVVIYMSQRRARAARGPYR